jgi:RIO kinase 1
MNARIQGSQEVVHCDLCTDAKPSTRQECKLVHGDLSEYNMLYFRGTLYMIDVSQSVEHDHPNSLEFLRRDAGNVNDYFKRNGVRTMTVRELFDFCVEEAIGHTDEQMQAYLDVIAQKTEARGGNFSAEEQIESAVFMQAFIPKSLADVDIKHVDRYPS